MLTRSHRSEALADSLTRVIASRTRLVKYPHLRVDSNRCQLYHALAGATQPETATTANPFLQLRKAPVKDKYLDMRPGAPSVIRNLQGCEAQKVEKYQQHLTDTSLANRARTGRLREEAIARAPAREVVRVEVIIG